MLIKMCHKLWEGFEFFKGGLCPSAQWSSQPQSYVVLCPLRTASW